jgi:hypothetical protein
VELKLRTIVTYNLGGARINPEFSLEVKSRGRRYRYILVSFFGGVRGAVFEYQPGWQLWLNPSDRHNGEQLLAMEKFMSSSPTPLLRRFIPALTRLLSPQPGQRFLNALYELLYARWRRSSDYQRQRSSTGRRVGEPSLRISANIPTAEK